MLDEDFPRSRRCDRCNIWRFLTKVTYLSSTLFRREIPSYNGHGFSFTSVIGGAVGSATVAGTEVSHVAE